MRVVAVDPGYDKVGVAVLEKENGQEKLLFSTCLKTNSAETFQERLAQLTSEFRAVAKKWKPDCVAIEKIYFNKNQKTATRVAEAKGAIIEASSSLGLKVHEYTPLEIKMATTGFGRASKKQVEEMVKKLVRIDKKIQEDDEYDAIACGLTCLATSRQLSTQ